MKKLVETLRSLGIEVPEEKEAEVRKKLSENYKNISEVEKATEKIESERDTWKERAETAEETLKKFDGVDVDGIQEELATWKQKAKEAEEDYKKKIEQRDFEDALKEEISNYKFSSDAAKKAIVAEISEAGLKVKDGKILGLSDLIGQMKEKDASAFVDEQQERLEQNKAKFTKPLNPGSAPGTKVSPAELMKMKNENPNLDIRQYME